jgi:hypothetical protein
MGMMPSSTWRHFHGAVAKLPRLETRGSQWLNGTLRQRVLRISPALRRWKGAAISIGRPFAGVVSRTNLSGDFSRSMGSSV